MKTKTIVVTNPVYIQKIKKILDDKAHIMQKIEQGKFAEVKADLKFAQPI